MHQERYRPNILLLRINIIVDIADFLLFSVIQMKKKSHVATRYPSQITMRPLSRAVPMLFATIGTILPSMSAVVLADEVVLPTVPVQGQQGRQYNAVTSTTATKTDMPLRDTPQSISVVTSSEMRDRSVQSIAEATRYVPGVSF